VEAVPRDAAVTTAQVEISGAGRVVIRVEPQAIARPGDGLAIRRLDQCASDSLPLAFREHGDVHDVERTSDGGEVGDLDRSRPVALKAQRPDHRLAGARDECHRVRECLGDRALRDVHGPRAAPVHLRQELRGARPHLGDGGGVRPRGVHDLYLHRHPSRRRARALRFRKR